MTPFKDARNLNSVIANAPAIILWGEPRYDRTIDFVTDNISRYGYSVQELVMKEAPFETLVFEPDRERVRGVFAAALEDGRKFLVMDYRIVDKEGRAHWVEEQVTFYLNEMGEAVMYQSCLMDVTIRKMTEEKLPMLRGAPLPIIEELDTKNLIRQILIKAIEFAGASDGSLCVPEDGGRARKIICGLGLFESMVGMIIPMEKGLMGRVMKEKRRVVIEDYRSYPARMNRDEYKDITTIIGIPLYRGDNLLGAMSIVFKDELKFFEERTLKLFDQVAAAASISLENSRLYEEARREAEERQKAETRVIEGYARLQKTFSDVIRTMGQIVGKKDPYTVGHQERVALLAEELGKREGLDDGRCEGLRIAGLVHDIGKIEVPGEILSKPGRLSRIEFELVKTHARSGYEILKEVDFPWPVAGITHQHHERLDGSGYPRGLKGDEILPEARILAVADVVESMMSYRPYRPALGLKAALDEIRARRNELYDPEAVDACLDLFSEQPGFISEG